MLPRRFALLHPGSEVRLDDLRAAAARPDQACGFLCGVRFPECRVGSRGVMDRDGGARIGECERNRTADAHAPTGDQCPTAGHGKSNGKPVVGVPRLW